MHGYIENFSYGKLRKKRVAAELYYVEAKLAAAIGVLVREH